MEGWILRVFICCAALIISGMPAILRWPCVACKDIGLSFLPCHKSCRQTLISRAHTYLMVVWWELIQCNPPLYPLILCKTYRTIHDARAGRIAHDVDMLA